MFTFVLKVVSNMPQNTENKQEKQTVYECRTESIYTKMYHNKRKDKHYFDKNKAFPIEIALSNAVERVPRSSSYGLFINKELFI